MTKNTTPTGLNTDAFVLWFDDLGTGNEKYNFLSNFYEGDPIVLPGVFWQGTFKVHTGGPLLKDDTGKDTVRTTYKAFSDPQEYENHPVEFATGEHAFQAMKAKGIGSSRDFFLTATADGPNNSKYLGRTLALRPDWEAVKYDVMAAILRAKYTLDREEGQRLLETGDRLLVEGTYWGDTVWGVDLEKTGLPGRNWLGTLLMARRAELRAQEAMNVSLVDYFVNGTGTFNTLYSL